MDKPDPIQEFVESIKQTYLERLLASEELWPPVRGDQLINLQLVETDKAEGFHGDDNKKTNQSPIAYGDLFRAQDGKKPVRKIIVEGNGGMGKTTLCSIVAEGWAEGKILKEFDCVLLLPLREDLISSAESLSDLLALLHSDESICESVVQQFKKSGGRGVLIIADGWDELDRSKTSKQSFLYKLLFGRVLPFVSVLLTSRPSASAPLHSLRTVDRLVEVVGFNEKNIEQYIESEFENYPKKASSLIMQLSSNQILQSICTVPLNCAIICNLWHTSDQALPSTLTELYILISLSIVLREFKKNFPESQVSLSLINFDSIPEHLLEDFWLTCKFAYESLSRDKIVFSEAELASLFPEGLDSSERLLRFGLLQSARSLLPVGQGLSFHFLHLTLHEFLAALHLVTLPSDEQLKSCDTQAKGYRYTMMWRFAFGLGTKKQGSNEVSKRVNPFSDTVVERFMSKFVVRQPPPPFNSFPRANGDENLLLCQCALESQNSAINEQVAKQVNGQLYGMHMGSRSKLLDCVAVLHVLSHTSNCPQMSLSLSKWGMCDKDLSGFVDMLSNAQQKGVQMLRLDLSCNELTSCSISALFQKAGAVFSCLKELHLEDNKIDGDGVNSIVTSLIQTSCNSLTQLSLSDNPLGVSGIQALERAVQAGVFVNLKEIRLANTLNGDLDINSALLFTLSKEIASNCPKLDRLHLLRNCLGIPGALMFGDIYLLLTNESPYKLLDMDNTLLNEKAITSFTDTILSSCERYNIRFQKVLPHWNSSYPHSGSYPRHAIALNNNPLGYGGFLALMRLLRSNLYQINGLYLSKSNLSSFEHADNQDPKSLASPTIGEQLCMEPFPQNDCLELLLLDGNDFSGDRVHVLAGFFNVCRSLKYIYCIRCHMTSEDLVQLLTKLRASLQTCSIPMRLDWWHLNDNFIDDIGVAALIEQIPEVFPFVEAIDLHGNPVSDEMKKKLKDCLQINRERNSQKKVGWRIRRARDIRKAADYQRKGVRRAAAFSTWKATSFPPRNEELFQEFVTMCDELLWEICYQLYKVLSQCTTVAPSRLPSARSPPSDSDDDDSYDSAQEEQDESFLTPSSPIPIRPDESPRLVIPELSLRVLTVELKTLTDPIQFGILLGIPQEEVTIAEKNYRNDIKGQKTALFQYIADNHKSLGITWSTIADALLDIHAGNLSLSIREKYCSAVHDASNDCESSQ